MFGVCNVHTSVKLHASHIALPIVYNIRTVRRRLIPGVLYTKKNSTQPYDFFLNDK